MTYLEMTTTEGIGDNICDIQNYFLENAGKWK